jgi:aspartate/methionine/tyrosine aminotransferase
LEIKEFGVEQWMNDYEDDAQFNLGETCVSPLSLHDLLMVTHVDEPKFMHELLHKRLTYGDIFGNVELKQNIARLYQTALKPDQIVTTHGAIGANNLVLNSLVAPDDEVVVVAPTYQQMQSIPEALGATVKLLQLTAEHNYLPDINELRQLVSSKTKLIILNNPNNPSGALMSEEVLRDIVAVAQKVDAYVMCDEVYRHLTQDDRYSPSIVDLYEHGIATSSMSKVFSLAGLRLGWIVTMQK